MAPNETDPHPPRIRGNDWGAVRPPELGAWEPILSASVVVPALGDWSRLDAVLAALAAQTYPERLIEVVVVADGSARPLRLSEARPKNTRVIHTADVRSRASAWYAGVAASEGDVVCLLGGGVVVCAEFVAAMLRWHHRLADAVVLGGINEALAAADHEAFLAAAGSMPAVSRALYDEAGGLDPALEVGEDVELGYRLAQAGAVFVPEPSAAWRRLDPGPPRDEAFEAAVLADRLPLPRGLRTARGRVWAVPLVRAVVSLRGEPYEIVRGCVDRLLGADEDDLQVLVAAEESAGLALLRTLYRSEPRVRFGPPEGRDPAVTHGERSPFVLAVPAYGGLGVSAVGALVEEANRHRAGLVRVVIPGVAPSVGCVALWRTAAVARARRVRRPGEPIEEAVADVAGLRWVDGEEMGVVDLRAVPPERVPCPPRWRTEDADLARAVAELRARVTRLTAERDRLLAQQTALAQQRNQVTRQRDTALAQRDQARAAVTFRGVVRRYARGVKRRLRRLARRA